MYDAIVIGARCAGSPTAMLLARAGLRVLLLDRSTFPSDTMSTHYLHPWGLAYLKTWGLLDQLLATGAPTWNANALDLGVVRVQSPVGATDDIDFAICPRRTLLDKILVDAAVGAGAEMREGFSVQELIFEDDRVVGLRGRGGDGSLVEERARLVIGADGLRSLVARTVQPAAYNTVPGFNCGYYAYFSGITFDQTVLAIREHRAILSFPTNHNLTCVAMEWPKGEFEVFRSDIEGNFLKTLELIPDLAEQVRAGHREERFIGASELPNQFLKPYGPGWALVGDAGYYKDPVTGTGISDAWRDASLLAEAAIAGLGEGTSMDKALAGYEQRRNELAAPLYQQTLFMASLPHPSKMMAQMQGAPA